MADLAWPRPILLRRRSTLEMLTLDPALELGAGGEARVLALDGNGALVAKLYHEPSIPKARKVALMMEGPPELDAAAATLAWPCDLLFDGRGTFAGFLMPRAEGPRLFEFYNPVTRRRTSPPCDYAFLHRVGANLAAAFEALHARGYVVGDVNESNVLVRPDARVTLVDTDSMQVREPEGGAIHRSRVGKPEFTPPELQGRSFADFDRSPEHDRFGLAALLFLLLMEGTHPFAGRLVDGSETPPVEERIQRGLFPHDGHAEIDPPRLAPAFELLDPALRALFVRAFAGGHADPAARPAAAEWRAALAEAAEALVACGANPRHRHGPHLSACPWCERAAVLRGRDPFPAHAPPAAPARPRPVRRHVPALPVVAGTRGFGPPAAPGQRPLVPVARPVLTQLGAAPAAAALASAPAPLPTAEEWAEQAIGSMGLLHPGAWIGPSAVLMFAGAELMVLGMIAFPIVLILTLVRSAEQQPQPRFAGTFAVPAAVLLLLAFWLVGALGGGSMAARTTADVQPWREGQPIVALPAWSLSFGEPSADVDSSLVSLLNPERVARTARESYPGWVADPERIELHVYVLGDGTVDPQSVQILGTRDRWLEDAMRRAARDMVFKYLDPGGEPGEGWVRLDVTAGP